MSGWMQRKAEEAEDVAQELDDLRAELDRTKAELETVTSHLADAQEIIQRQMKEKATAEQERDRLRSALVRCHQHAREAITSGWGEVNGNRQQRLRDFDAAVASLSHPPEPANPEAAKCSICGGPQNHKWTCGGTGRAQ